MNEYLKKICLAFDILIPYLKELLGESHIFAISDGEVFNRINEKDLPPLVKPGDKVIYSKYAGTEVKLDEEEFIIVRQNDIVAIVED